MTTNESPDSKPTRARNEIERLTPSTEIGDWECLECGHIRENSSRPEYCPGCNRDDGDMPAGVLLFATAQ